MAPDTDYRIKLQVFEGPLDLLLFLIRKNEIDIYDIPIESVTKQYLEALRAMQSLDLEVAGEFFVMAATLMEIKSRMLLPKGLHAIDPNANPVELARKVIQTTAPGDAADPDTDPAELARQVIAQRGAKPAAPAPALGPDGAIDQTLLDVVADGSSGQPRQGGQIVEGQPLPGNGCFV